MSCKAPSIIAHSSEKQAMHVRLQRE